MKINLLKYKLSYWDRFNYRLDTAPKDVLPKLAELLGFDWKDFNKEPFTPKGEIFTVKPKY